MSDKDILLKLASKVIYERKRKNLSQEQLAEISGVSMRAISKLESGLSNIKFLTLYKLAVALKINVSKLVDFHL